MIKETMNFIKKATLSKDDRTLLKAGFMDENMNLTHSGREAIEYLNYNSVKVDLVKMAVEAIEEAKED